MTTLSSFLSLVFAWVSIIAPQQCEAFVVTSSSYHPTMSRRDHSITMVHANDDVPDDDRGLDIPSFMTRRDWLHRLSLGTAFMSTAVVVLLPQSAAARWVLDEDTGEYVQVEDVDWQTAWKQRLDKASSMSQDEIFAAARGAANRDDTVEESPASRKRRALSACRNPILRGTTMAEKECTARVLNGESDFILDALTSGDS